MGFNYFRLWLLKFMTNDKLNIGNAETERNLFCFGNGYMT